MEQNVTDLALEANERLHAGTDAQKPEGIAVKEETTQGITVTSVDVLTPDAAKRLGKPVGTYITLELRALFEQGIRDLEPAQNVLAGKIAALLRQEEEKPVLVVGLGNAAVTPDSIGPRTLEHLFITRHLIQSDPETFGAFRSCCAIAPGVLGTTGLESAEIVRGVLSTCGAKCMIVIDALAACEQKRLCTTIQLSDAGIVPGSGIGNHRKAFTRQTLHVPVYAIGVPTVIRAQDLEGKNQSANDLIVTPSDIDGRVQTITKLLAGGINRALFPQMSSGELLEFSAF